MKVKEIMSKEIISLSPNDYVSNLISLVEKYHLRQIPIIERKIFKGIVYSKGVAEMRLKDPAKTKISSLIEHAPTLSSEQEIEEAADLMFKSNLRLLPVIENKKVVGIISMPDIIGSVSKTPLFRQTQAEQIMSQAEVIDDEEDIGRARILMREKNVSRLPVVDNNKKLVGIITIFDLLRSIKPQERMDFYSMAAEKEKITGIKVSSMMNKTPILAQKKTSLNEIASLMLKKGTDGVVITENDYPIGIVSMKDLLEAYVFSLGERGIFYQIIGIDEDDDFVLPTVERMIKDTVQKVSKIFKPQFFFLHVKKYSKKGKIKYSVRVRFKTNKRTFISKSYAWDLRDAIDDALTKLERIVIKEKKIYRSRKRQILKFKKLSG